MMNKINVRDWLIQEEVDRIEMLNKALDVTKVPEQLINFDRLIIYENTTEYELGVEISSELGIINNEGIYGRYFDYGKFAQDLLSDHSSGYHTVDDDSRYLYICELCRIDDDIMLGVIKTGFAKHEFVKLEKHHLAYGGYWSHGQISNNGMSCGIKEYYDKKVDEVFECTWMTEEVWDKFRYGMDEIKEVLGNETNTDKIGAKLDTVWNYLMEQYKKVELVLE